MKPKLGLQIGERLLIANRDQQSSYLLGFTVPSKTVWKNAKPKQHVLIFLQVVPPICSFSFSFLLVSPVPLAQVLPRPQMMNFLPKTWFFWNLFEFSTPEIV